MKNRINTYKSMKKILLVSAAAAAALFMLLMVSGCSGRSGNADSHPENDTASVPDTGYTGIKQYMTGDVLVKEVTFENGVRQGIMRSFYRDGRVRQSFWYEKGLREDSAKWYYETGEVFRSTPYKNDTADGIQKQYYRTGKLKAKMEFKKGLRTTFLEEYAPNGKLITGYSDIVVSTRDDYRNGTYRITLSLSDKSDKVRFYRGDLVNGAFDTAKVDKIPVVNGTGNIVLKKSGSPQQDHVGVIAEILTNFGNNRVAYKRIDLPYKDLK
jgi:hypothetical protein